MMEILVAIFLITAFDVYIDSKQKCADMKFACKTLSPFPSLLK